MAQRIDFIRTSEDQLIHLPVSFQYGLQPSAALFVLDTGASHTVIDLNTLYLLGYRQDDSSVPVEVLTAGGVI